MVGSDPAPAINLRLALEASRARHEDFLVAWPRARRLALHGLEGNERAAWGRAFDATRIEWYDAYDREGRAMALAVELVEA